MGFWGFGGLVTDWWLMLCGGVKWLILCCLGVLLSDRRTDGQTDIWGCRVAFATENAILHLICSMMCKFVDGIWNARVFEIRMPCKTIK